VEIGIRRGAAVALTVAQVRSGHTLHYLVGLSEGQELADHDGSWEDFDEVADAVIDLVLDEGIVEEATRHLGARATTNIKVEPYWPALFCPAPRISMSRPP
jgi:hypothetical protein